MTPPDPHPPVAAVQKTKSRRSSLFVLISLLAVATVLVLVLHFWLTPPPPPAIDYKMPGNPQSKIQAGKAAAVERREKLIDQTIWAREMQAQEHGRIFEDFWDALNAATNKLDAVSSLEFGSITLGNWSYVEHLPHQIERRLSTNSGPVVSRDQFIARVQELHAAGWRLVQTEFRHNAFDPQTNGLPARSQFHFSAHFTNALAPARAAIDGKLLVAWTLRATNHPPAIQRLDAAILEIKFRPGPPAFVPILNEVFDPPNLSDFIEPLLVHDLDNDGVPEIALPAINQVFRRQGESYVSMKFCAAPRLQIFGGLLADFNRDGLADFIFTNPDGVFMLDGGPGGEFASPPRRACDSVASLDSPRALTCGDVDSDGDLDLFIGQYKGPFLGGQMPTPYYDANDGFASYFLLNDGRGGFSDATAASGLAPKRFRRVYSASFVDLDSNGALDLVVTSDFAGADIYRNDGRGNFTDITHRIDDPHAFGMGHAFADFNNDGRLDFFMGGMTSPTAARLEHLRLHRPHSRLDSSMRAKMTLGSRLYFSQEDGSLRQDTISMSVSGSGWTWGAAAADFDNDGFTDLYIANGMESRRTVRDYEQEFWLHDIFVADSRHDEVAQVYLSRKGQATRGQGDSFGGFDKNRFWLNQNGREFIDVAHLLGLAEESDGRNLVATDLDHDGRVDLVITSIDRAPPHQNRLQIFRNELRTDGNWVGFQFPNAPGANVTIIAGGMKQTIAIVTGDSFRSQSPFTARFGLGKNGSVDSAEIRWPGGAVTRIAGPEIKRLTFLKAPSR